MQPENRIHLLPKSVADKIAAGEVVDRPLSVVKELLENAIDAKASTIVIDIRNGGKTYIRVTDDGCGIAKQDLFLAFERHATSKLENEDDLYHISSLGFRGEALASIAAVSRVELITKPKEDSLGSRIKLEAGQVIEQSDTGCPDGTTILVTDLFYNTPARRKFLKTEGTEGTAIIDFVSKMALAYPNIRFRMIHNGAVLFSTPGRGSVSENLTVLYSKEISHRLISVQEQETDYALEAYLSPVDLSRINKKHQVFFVNGRSITSPFLDRVIREVYQERIADGRFPVAYLFLRVNPQLLDVNIHPNKREIRFDRQEDLQRFLVSNLKKALRSEESLASIEIKTPFRYPAVDPNPQGQPEIIQELPTKAEQVDINNFLYQKRVEETEKDQPTEEKPIPNHANTDWNRHVQNQSNDFFHSIQIIGSVFATYIMAIDANNFYLIDQHAAHERIFYEHFLRQHKAQEIAKQPILQPILRDLTPSMADRSFELIENLEQCSFHLELFGPRTLLVKEIPAFMNLDESERFLEDFIDQWEEERTSISQTALDKMIMHACKSAVKANDQLDLSEMQQLIHDLAKAENPYSCPHGRPTFVKLTKYELERLFKRA